MGAMAAGNTGNKKIPTKSGGVNIPEAAFQPTNRPTECRSHKGENPLWAAGAKTSSRQYAFVRQTTPHFGGTSRKVFYSVRAYHTSKTKKSKEVFQNTDNILSNKRHQRLSNNALGQHLSISAGRNL